MILSESQKNKIESLLDKYDLILSYGIDSYSDRLDLADSFREFSNSLDMNYEDTARVMYDYSYSELDRGYNEKELIKYFCHAAYEQDMSKIIKNSLLPERYSSNNEFHIFIQLLSRMFGEINYYKESLSSLINVDKCDERFLSFLADNIGYDIPEGSNVDDVRFLIKYFLSLRRQRGTIVSIRNAVKFSGRDEMALLQGEEGIDVDIKEIEGEGLFYIESSNINIETIQESLREVKPAGTKWTYALRYSIPFLNSIGNVSTWRHIYIDTKSDSLSFNLTENSIGFGSNYSQDLNEVFVSNNSTNYSESDDIDIISGNLNELVMLNSSNDSPESDNLEVRVGKNQSYKRNLCPKYGISRYGTSIYGDR